MTKRIAELVRHFQAIYIEHMQQLPIVNPKVPVAAVGFRKFDGHELGVLLTPWFMNLVLLPSGDEWRDSVQGDASTIDFPSGPMEFTVSRDDVLGTYLTAVLLRSVADVPDSLTAHAIAEKVLEDLFVEAGKKRSLSRRELLTGMRSS